MGDKKENMIERAPTARSSCKDCGQKIEKDALRFGLVDFGFSDSGSYKYYHLACAKRRKPRDVEEVLENRGDAQPVSRKEIEEELGGGAKSSAPAMKASAIPEWLATAPTPKDLPAFATEASPPIKDGAALDAASTAKLVDALHRETTQKKAKKGEATVAQFDAWLGADEMRAFVWRIFEVWSQSDGYMRHKWLFRALTDRLDDRLGFKLAPIIEHWVKENKKNAVEAGLEALAESNTEASLMVIEGLSQRFHYKGAYNIARRVLEDIAKKRGLDVFELEDRLVPRCGLDDDGTKAFDLGGKTVTLRVDQDLRAELENADKSRMKSVPAKFPEAKAAFDLLRTELEAALKTQSARLEQSLSTGRRWKKDDWETYLRKHPLMRHLVRRLVWGSYDAKGNLQNAFVVDEEGALMDADLGKSEIAGKLVGLVHPVELDDASRGKWGTVLGDFQIIQPFHQLARGPHAPKSDDKGVLRDIPTASLEPAKFHGVMNRLGWMKGAPDYTIVRSFYKHFTGLGVFGIVEISPGMSVQGWDKDPQTITAARFAKEPPGYEGVLPKALPIRDVSPIAVSEVLHDVAALASA
jgi:hypothetical protein